MVTFTLSGDPHVERRVAEDMGWIAKLAAERLRPRAVLALGSFGRSEGRVVRAANGGVEYVSDVEIAVLSATPKLPLSAYAKASREASERLGTDVNLYYTPPLRLALARTRHPRYRLDRPLLATFDFRMGSRLLHGEDVLSRLPAADPRAIPPIEGLRLLGNRAAELLVARNARAATGAAADKLALATGDALLIARGQHALGLRDRQERLQAGTAAGWVPRLVVEAASAAASRRIRGEHARDAPAPVEALRAGVHALAGLATGAPLRDALRALLAGPDAAGGVHTSSLPSAAWWTRALRRRLARRNIAIEVDGDAHPEWVIYAGCVAELLGDPEAAPATIRGGSWSDAWPATLN